MEAILLACMMSMTFAGGAFAHKLNCDDFPTYADAVRHCKAVHLISGW